MTEQTADTTVSGERIKSYIERIERLDEERQGLADDKKEIWAQAKGAGFDVPTLRNMVRLRKIDPQKRREAGELLDMYEAAIGNP